MTVLNRLLVCVVLIFSSAPTFAESEVVCNFEGTVAFLIMSSRQNGENIGQMIKESPKSKGLIMRAYEQPRFDSDEYKKKAIKDFENEIILECLKREPDES